MGEELARPAAARLDFVQHQHRSGPVAEGAQLLQEAVGGQLNARNTLDAFDDDGGIRLRSQLFFSRFQVAKRDEGDVGGGIERGADLGIVRRGHGAGRAAVEGAAEGQNLGAAGLEGRQLEGVLIGLGSAVAQEQVIAVIAADPAQFGRQGILEAVLHGIGVEPQLLELLLDGRYILRMAVPDADHRMTAVQVQVFLAVFIPQRGTRTLHRFDVPSFIYIE